MLKPLLAALLISPLLLAQTATAQALLNGGLETWETRKGQELPVNWLTLYDLDVDPEESFPVGSVTKSTDKRGGDFAAKLTATAAVNSIIPGAMFLGTKIGADEDLPGGLPITSRPTQLQFYYKLSGTELVEEPAEIEVTLTKTTNQVRAVVGEGTLALPAGAAVYTLGTVLITYSAATVPDSIHVSFSSGAGEGSTLFIDDVSVLGLPTPTRAAQADQALASVYPNPSAQGLFTLSAAAKDAATAPFSVTDAAGRLVLREAASTGAAPRTIDLQHQPAGVYLLRLDAPSGAIVRRLLIN